MKIKTLLMKIKRSQYVKEMLKLLFYAAGKLPTHKKTIIFESFLGKQYSDSPKSIYEYIKKEYPDYKLYWSVDRKYLSNFQKNGYNYLIRFSLKWIYQMGTARYWVVNSRLPLWIPKPKHTIYIQTWHGTPLKKLGVDINEVHMPGTNTNSYKENFIYEASKWDYLVSPNAYSTEIFKRAFDFKQTIIESGYPRNDILYTDNNELKSKGIKNKLNILPDKKIILYAPTWRDDDYYSTGNYRFSLELDLNQLKVEFGDDFVILLRMHYLVAEQFDLSVYKNFVYDVSSYNDIGDLYLISDVLITDYSSVFFDYANLRRPILFFTYDIEKYRNKLRGFYFNIEEEAPGPLLKTTGEIISYLQLIRDDKYQLPLTFESFYNKYCYLEDGNASERVVNQFLEKGKLYIE
ncbi:CDP-glycerol glycerophosphotransferase [Virgibacillus halotolerans]|nr:CDP-glycerol glycerophosphotransferase [Virgibacillus halotolerans]